MDDGGRCLLDVINDPQLLQSFLDNSPATTTTTTTSATDGIGVASAAPPSTAVAALAPAAPNNLHISTSTPLKHDHLPPATLTPVTAIVPVTVPAKQEAVKARKSCVATKSIPLSTGSDTKSRSRQQQQHVSKINVLNNGIILDSSKSGLAGATVPGPQTIPVSSMPGLSLPISIGAGGQIVAATSQPPSIRSTGGPNFVPASFTLGPRPGAMTMLPQQFIVQPNGSLQPVPQTGTIPTQFVITRPPTPQIGPKQLLQIIQTSQGAQIVPGNSGTPQVHHQALVSTSNLTAPTSTSTKTSKNSNKQILPKISNSGAAGGGGKNVSNSNIVNSQPNNIKMFGQAQPATQAQTLNAGTGPTQFLLGSGPQQTGIITGPQGTFLLNNIGLPNLGGGPFYIQGNVPNQPLQLAIRPQGTPFIVNHDAANHHQLNMAISNSQPNAGGSKPGQTAVAQSNTHHILLNHQNNHAAVSQAGGLVMTTGPAGIRPGAPANIIIRPQMLGQTQTASQAPQPTATATTTQSQPQLIQIQTPNGPILLQLNLNNPPVAPPPQAAPAISLNQPMTPGGHQLPQTIQIGNTVISLAANNGPGAANPLNMAGIAASGNANTVTSQQQHHHLPATILTQQTGQDAGSALLGIPTSTSSSMIINDNPPAASNSTGKSQTQTALFTSPKPPPPGSAKTATKGLNLADLLKETGILTDFSPPSSPGGRDSVSSNFSDFSTQQQQQTSTVPQQTVAGGDPSPMMIPAAGLGNSGQNVPVQSNPAPSQPATLAPPLPPPLAPPVGSQQLRISLGPDGTIVLLSPNSNALLAAGNQLLVGSNLANPSSSSKDSSGLGSSQPSPDSTTPSIDATSSPTSSSSTTTSVPQSISLSSSSTIVHDTSSSTTNSASTRREALEKPLSTSSSQHKIDTNGHFLFESQTDVAGLMADTTAAGSARCLTSQIMVSSVAGTTAAATGTTATPAGPNQNSAQPPTQTAITTAVLVPGTIMFVNDQTRVPIATINRSNLHDLLNRLDGQLTALTSIKSPTGQQKQLLLEMMALQKNLEIIHSQQLSPNQLKVSPAAQQMLQLQAIGTPVPSAAPVQFVIKPPAVAAAPANCSVSTASPLLNVVGAKSAGIDAEGVRTHKTKVVINPCPTVPIVVAKPEKSRSNVLKVIQSQLQADQNAGVNSDFKTPFRSRDDACKRLLRYHVFDQQVMSEQGMKKFDELYETISRKLLYKKSQLYNKFSYLLLKQSMKLSPSSEHVMISRMMINDEQEALKSDKEFIANGGVLDLPPLPESWLKNEKSAENDKDESFALITSVAESGVKRKHSDDDEHDDELLNCTNALANYHEAETAVPTVSPDLDDLCDMLATEEEKVSMAPFSEESTSQPNDFLSSDHLHQKQSLDLGPVFLSNHDVSVDELIKQLHSPSAAANQSAMADQQDFMDSFDNNVPFTRSNFVGSGGNAPANSGSLSNMIPDPEETDLEALYSNITSNDRQTSSSSHWSNNHHSGSSSINLSSMMNSHHRLSWNNRYGSVNETEAAVAVQSIIDDTAPNDEQSVSDIEFVTDSTVVEFVTGRQLPGDSRGCQANSYGVPAETGGEEHDHRQRNAIESIMMASAQSSSSATSAAYQGPSLESHISSQQQQHHHHGLLHNPNYPSPSSSSNHLHHHQRAGPEVSNHHYSSASGYGSSSGTAALLAPPPAPHIVHDPMLDEAVKSIL